MKVMTFTPTKFALLLAVSVAAALVLPDRPAESQTRVDLPSSVRFQEAVGQDNGTLAAQLYLASSAAPTRGTDRRSISPLGPSVVKHHFNLPVAR